MGGGVALAVRGARPAEGQMNARKRTSVEAQVHLWKAESPDWPWVPGRPPQLPAPFTIEKLVPLMDEAGADRGVGVPPSAPGGRNRSWPEAAPGHPVPPPGNGRRAVGKPQPTACL